jgi:hypothetical protein
MRGGQKPTGEAENTGFQGGMTAGIRLAQSMSSREAVYVIRAGKGHILETKDEKNPST